MGAGKTLRDLMDVREPLYEKYADVTMDVGQADIREAAQSIASWVNGDGAQLRIG